MDDLSTILLIAFLLALLALLAYALWYHRKRTPAQRVTTGAQRGGDPLTDRSLFASAGSSDDRRDTSDSGSDAGGDSGGSSD